MSKLKRSKRNSNSSESGTRTMSEKAELEIPNSPSPDPESLPFFLRISWTLFQTNSTLSVLAVPSKQSCQTTAKISGVPPRRIKATRLNSRISNSEITSWCTMPPRLLAVTRSLPRSWELAPHRDAALLFFVPIILPSGLTSLARVSTSALSSGQLAVCCYGGFTFLDWALDSWKIKF